MKDEELPRPLQKWQRLCSSLSEAMRFANRILAASGILFTALADAQEYAPDNPDLQARLDRFAGTVPWQPVDLTPEERNRLIAYSRSRLAILKGTPGEKEYVMDLILLGDEETIRAAIDNEDAARAWATDLITSASPVGVEVLMPYILKEESLVDKMVGDVRDVSISHHLAAHVLPAILERSSAFDPAVRKWAERILKSQFPDSQARLEWSRSVIRDWWHTNERLFLEKKYRDTKPGAVPSLPVNSVHDGRETEQALGGTEGESTERPAPSAMPVQATGRLSGGPLIIGISILTAVIGITIWRVKRAEGVKRRHWEVQGRERG